MSWKNIGEWKNVNDSNTDAVVHDSFIVHIRGNRPDVLQVPWRERVQKIPLVGISVFRNRDLLQRESEKMNIKPKWESEDFKLGYVYALRWLIGRDIKIN